MEERHTRLAAVIGWPIGHSWSPRMHNAAYAAAGLNAVYLALPVKPPHLAQAVAGIRALGFLGASITVPFKVSILNLCDELDPVARQTGAVNTVVPTAAGALRGHNTDVAGFRDALVEAAPDVVDSGRRAVVLGAGGAARAVAYALGKLGIPRPTIVARILDRARSLVDTLGMGEARPWTAAELAAAVAGAGLIVDATSASLDEETERLVPASVPLEIAAQDALVCSLVYHREPALLVAARRLGMRTLDGSAMLLHQAFEAFELMTGTAAPREAMRSVLSPSLAAPAESRRER
ncbi:MAG: shikimate dehydrogenase [Pseudomonadota bacterium]